MTDDFDVDFNSDDDELGFAPAISVTGAEKSSESTANARPARSGSVHQWRRRFAGVVALMMALVAMGGLYGLFASSSSANNTASVADQVASGRQLFDVSCITCHGANLQGVTNRGPSLIGV